VAMLASAQIRHGYAINDEIDLDTLMADQPLVEMVLRTFAGAAAVLAMIIADDAVGVEDHDRRDATAVSMVRKVVSDLELTSHG
jgi:hypothetical protein